MLLTARYENYLKAVWADEEWDRTATNGTLAAALGLAPSSVTEAVRKLADAGLLEHAAYGAVTLTAAGRAIATGIVRKHRLIETFLVVEFGYRWDEVHAEAEVLEHAVSTDFIDRLDARLGRPERDPHGDLIPRADGSMPIERAVPLSAIASGEAVRVVRVSDAVPGLLARLDQLGLGLGSEIEPSLVSPEQAAGVLVEPARPV